MKKITINGYLYFIYTIKKFMITYIYILKDPISSDIRYVGKSNNPAKRLNYHIAESRKNTSTTHKKNWIRKLLSENLKPILEIIKEVPKNNWQEYEKYYINYYISIGCKLVNYNDNGGEGLTYGNQTSFKKGHGTKKIVVLTKKGEYIKTLESTEQAKLFVGTSVCAMLSKRTKSVGGYICLYESDYINMSYEDMKTFVDYCNTNNGLKNGLNTRFKKGSKSWNAGLKTGKSKKRKKILQYDKITKEFIREWDYVGDAAHELGLSAKAILNNLLLVSKNSGGFIWSYTKLTFTDEEKVFYVCPMCGSNTTSKNGISCKGEQQRICKCCHKTFIIQLN